MKLASFFRTTLLLNAAFVFLTPRVLCGQNTNASSELVCGDATNGFRGEIELVLRDGHLADVVVWVHHITDNNVALSFDAIGPARRHCVVCQCRCSLPKAMDKSKLSCRAYGPC